MIRADGLSKVFPGGVKALDGVSFEARDNAVTGVLGPDGAGKTTLCRILACVMAPTGGDAFVGGLSCLREGEKVKGLMGYMPRDYGLYPDLTVSENMDFYADLFGVFGAERRKRKDKILSAVRMDRFADRRSGLLSGGMKQKLQLSCALMHSPKYLVLDEPGYGVDPVSRRDFWALVSEISRESTVLASTSYMDESRHFSEVVILNRGRVAAVGTPDSIIDSVGGGMFAVVCGDPGGVSKRTGHMFRSVNLYGDRMHVVFREGFSEESLSALVNSGEIRSVSPVRPSMEDAFISLTGGDRR